MKLTPNVADPAAVAAAAAEGGADAVSLINTLKAAGLDPATLRPWLGAGSGGLSGPAVRPIALEQVRRVAAAVSIPVIGMGGIETGRDALGLPRRRGDRGRGRHRELPRPAGGRAGPRRSSAAELAGSGARAAAGGVALASTST